MPRRLDLWNPTSMLLVTCLAGLVWSGCGSTTAGPPAQPCTPTTVISVDASQNAKMVAPSGAKSVAVYWDVSKSMEKLGGPADEVVSSQDSQVFPLVGVSEVAHYAVGDDIKSLKSATGALTRDQGRSVLHKAAEDIGLKLRSGEITTAVVVSDLDLEVTNAERDSGEAPCVGVPAVSDQYAGGIFGSCIAAAFRHGSADPAAAATGPALLQEHFVSMLYSEVPNSKYSPLLVLVVSADPAVGRALHDQMLREWDHGKHPFGGTVLADSSRFSIDPALNCQPRPTDGWQARKTFQAIQSSSCGYSCDGGTGVLQLDCDGPGFLAADTAGLCIHAGSLRIDSIQADGRTIAPGQVSSRDHASAQFSPAAAGGCGQLTLEGRCPPSGGCLGAPETMAYGVTLAHSWVEDGQAAISLPPAARPGDESYVRHANNVETLFRSLIKNIMELTAERRVEVNASLGG